MNEEDMEGERNEERDGREREKGKYKERHFKRNSGERERRMRENKVGIH